MKNKIVCFLFFLFSINFELCLAQGLVSDTNDLDPKPYGHPEVQAAIESSCKKAEQISCDNAYERALEKNYTRKKNCRESKKNKISSVDADCSISEEEFIKNEGSKCLPQCNDIDDDGLWICSDPTATIAPEPELASNCPCPGGVEVFQDGCNISVTCVIGGDNDAEFTVKSPCPTVRGSDPKYPLVKMLSGTLVEWNDAAGVSYNTMEVSWGASGGHGEPGDYYGATIYEGLNYEIIVSSIDMGQGVKFNLGAANAKKNTKNPLDRRNIEFALTGSNPNVEILSQKDIYNAYKNRSKYVQAYTVLEGKGYKERPWTTYDKFIDAMCNMSADKSRCKKELAYTGHRDTEMWENLYLGNGNTSIIGLYSEISSHGCHGATVLNDKDEPAFGIKISSTWCFYFHASWGGRSVWLIDSCDLIRNCCKEIGEVHETHTKCDTCEGDNGEDEECNCREEHTVLYYCKRAVNLYAKNDAWVGQGGGESTGDCGICSTVSGYVDIKGNFSKDPYPISFYQSQPLLIK